MTRQVGIACRSIRTASSISSVTPVRGCAMIHGQVTHAFQHICWDGCMFPNAKMLDPQTWTDVLRVMIAVRNAHGWN